MLSKPDNLNIYPEKQIRFYQYKNKYCRDNNTLLCKPHKCIKSRKSH